MKQARNLENAFDNFSNDALTFENFSDFYVEADNTRGEKPVTTIKRILTLHPLESKHILFTGFRGCGKSTELIRLQRDLFSNFMLINFSVRRELDSNSFSHTELLIATMKQLFSKAIEENLDIDEDVLKPIENWNIVKSLVENNSEGYSGEMETGGSIGAKLPWLFEIFTKLTAKAKLENSYREELKQVVQPNVTDLISSCNILIREIKKLLEAKNKGLLVIIEDLDKIDLGVGEDLFLRYSERLVSLQINTIYTFPIALRNHENAQAIFNKFDHFEELPMIKTNLKNGDIMPQGRDLLKSIVARRMSLDLFESEEILTNFIKYSGGVIWDLFRSLRDAMSNALNWERDKISEEDWKKAYYAAIKNYRPMIAERHRNGQLIKVDEYYEIMVNLAKSEDKQPEFTTATMDLRQNLCILGYNTEGWYDVHPIMKDILIQKKLLDESFRVR
jgi:DNA polymerase III delta prime subunit